MKRYYSDSQLESLFRQKYSPDVMDEMMEKIIEDDRSMNYLDLLASEEVSSRSGKQEMYSTLQITEIVNKVLSREQIPKTGDIKSVQPLAKPYSPKFGQIYETLLPLNWPWPHQERRMIAVLSDETGSRDQEHPDVVVAPLSFDISQSTEHDLVIQSPDSPLGAAFMVRLTDVQNIFVRQLHYYYGEIPETYYELLKTHWLHAAGVDDKNLSDNMQNIAQNPAEPKYQFALKEHDITEYMRIPVLRTLNLTEQYPHVETFDLSHLLDINILRTEKDVLREIAFLQAPQEREAVRLAADSIDLIPWSQASQNYGYTLFRSNEFILKLVIRENGAYIWSFKISEPDVHIVIHEEETSEFLFEEVIDERVSGHRIFKIIALDFLNKKLALKIKQNHTLCEKYILLYHEYAYAL